MATYTEEEKMAARDASRLTGPLYAARCTHKETCMCAICLAWTLLYQVGNHGDVNPIFKTFSEDPQRETKS